MLILFLVCCPSSARTAAWARGSRRMPGNLNQKALRRLRDVLNDWGQYGGRFDNISVADGRARLVLADEHTVSSRRAQKSAIYLNLEFNICCNYQTTNIINLSDPFGQRGGRPSVRTNSARRKTGVASRGGRIKGCCPVPFN